MSAWRAVCSAALVLATPASLSARVYSWDIPKDSEAFRWIDATAGEDDEKITEWPPIVIDGFGVSYIKLKKIEPGDFLGTMSAWVRKDYYRPFPDEDFPARSEIVRYEIDCSQRSWMSTKYRAFYDRLGGVGNRLLRVTKSDSWPIEPDSSEGLFADFVCKLWVPRPSSSTSAAGIR